MRCIDVRRYARRSRATHLVDDKMGHRRKDETVSDFQPANNAAVIDRTGRTREIYRLMNARRLE